MMGKISSRCRQAKPGDQNPTDDVLGGLSCIGVGDPAQCPPISDELFYDTAPHRATASEATSQRVQFSNQGKTVYDTFEDVIILQYCHRVHRRTGDNLSEADQAYDERGQRFWKSWADSETAHGPKRTTTGSATASSACSH